MINMTKDVKGIYKFVEENMELFKLILFLKIPYNSIESYDSNFLFDIKIVTNKTNNEKNAFLKIQTERPSHEIYKTHVYITKSDMISCNDTSESVFNLIIDTYIVESRNRKLENILS